MIGQKLYTAHVLREYSVNIILDKTKKRKVLCSYR